MNDMDYNEFLNQKIKSVENIGFSPDTLNPNLFEFQEHILNIALKKGRFAIFADCGLGKTLMQLEWARKVSDHTRSKVLILAPLAVTEQTRQEAYKFDISLYNIDIYNYEQIDNITAGDYQGIVLDESSILKNYEGKLKIRIVSEFEQTPFKLACTATPSPNDPMELGNHSEFLGVMSRSEMLATYFVHDGSETQKWRIKGHAEDQFYGWVSQWAIMLSKPSDIGFSDEGYNLPGLNIKEEQITTDKKNNGRLFNDTAISATEFNGELRATMKDRMSRVADIVNNSSENFIVWIKQNAEGDYLRKLIPEAIEVRGSDNAQHKESKLLGFAKNEYRVLITKAKIAQFGMNFQNCHNQIMASLDFSFESLYQCIRRSHRFGQKNKVNIYVITTDTMKNVIDSIKTKQKNFEIMQQKMTEGTNTQIVAPKPDSEDVNNDNFYLMKGDCVERTKELEDNSIHYTIFSPPFSSMYTYTDHIEDMGNCKEDEEFYQHFKFLITELYRVTMPGRHVSFHCMNLPTSKSRDGYIGIKDFRGMLIRAFEDEGFIYHSEVCIWKDPVVAMQRTKALGLLHKQIKKDSAMSRMGIPDYVVTMRKPGENPEPISHSDEDFPVDVWQKMASPIWTDINQSDTLQYQSARDNKDEKHICPLQLTVIKRCINLWTNKGDTVFSPFSGIGSEVYQAIKLGRYGIGIELKQSYFDQSVKNCNAATQQKMQTSLF